MSDTMDLPRIRLVKEECGKRNYPIAFYSPIEPKAQQPTDPKTWLTDSDIQDLIDFVNRDEASALDKETLNKMVQSLSREIGLKEPHKTVARVDRELGKAAADILWFILETILASDQRIQNVRFFLIENKPLNLGASRFIAQEPIKDHYVPAEYNASPDTHFVTADLDCGYFWHVGQRLIAEQCCSVKNTHSSIINRSPTYTQKDKETHLRLMKPIARKGAPEWLSLFWGDGGWARKETYCTYFIGHPTRTVETKRWVEIVMLHAQQCPNCPWNGFSIFP